MKYNLIPTFAYLGGKARLARRMAALFPAEGRLYLEAFAGRANVFFAVKQTYPRGYASYWLNDKYTFPFLRALKRVDLTTLPALVSKLDFYALASRPSDLALVLEPRITVAGKGYQAGFQRTNTNYYRANNYRANCAVAQALLHKVKLTGLQWWQIDYADFGPNDFVYFDPPYRPVHTDNKSMPYPNIQHGALLSMLTRARFRWALSGYETNEYKRILGEPAYRFNMKSEILKRTSNAGERVECLWVNYKITTGGLT